MNGGPNSPQRQSKNERVLRIYVAEHCGTCRESRRLARVIARRVKDITVEVVDIDHQEPVDEIFAVPTFCYRGKILSLGNPQEDELVARVLSLDQRADDATRPGTSTQERGRHSQRIPEPSEVSRDPFRRRTLRGKKGLATAWCGALGIGGVLLCSLTMLAPALGLIAGQAARSSMGGISGSASAGHAQLPAWWEALVRLGPEILVASVLLVALVVALRRRLAALPAMVGGLILYLGMYVQPSLVVMEAATVLGIALLVLAYVAGLRPALPHVVRS